MMPCRQQSRPEHRVPSNGALERLLTTRSGHFSTSLGAHFTHLKCVDTQSLHVEIYCL